jgi:L-ascorbate metabolism protein UlaG (beta-lactamase superfamily)
MKLVHLGDLGHQPDTAEQRAILKDVDILLIPIGGTFTITTPEAVKLIETFKPRAAVAMHYQNDYCHFPITDCSAFVAATRADALPNSVEIFKNALAGCYTMAI